MNDDPRSNRSVPRRGKVPTSLTPVHIASSPMPAPTASRNPDYRRHTALEDFPSPSSRGQPDDCCADRRRQIGMRADQFPNWLGGIDDLDAKPFHRGLDGVKRAGRARAQILGRLLVTLRIAGQAQALFELAVLSVQSDIVQHWQQRQIEVEAPVAWTGPWPCLGRRSCRPGRAICQGAAASSSRSSMLPRGDYPERAPSLETGVGSLPEGPSAPAMLPIASLGFRAVNPMVLYHCVPARRTPRCRCVPSPGIAAHELVERRNRLPE